MGFASFRTFLVAKISAYWGGAASVLPLLKRPLIRKDCRWRYFGSLGFTLGDHEVFSRLMAAGILSIPHSCKV